MLLQITNNCDNNCPHCLHACVGPEHCGHMSQGVFTNSLALCRKLGVNIIIISGGEPTLHPKWAEWTREALRTAASVGILTNGNWLIPETHTLIAGTIVDLLRENKGRFIVQICSDPMWYPNHEGVVAGYKRFTERFPDVIKFVDFTTKVEHMVSLGRAASNPDCLELAEKDKSITTSCFTGAALSAQTDFKTAVCTLEAHGKFCKPLIDFDGGIHWSESHLCPEFFKLPSHLAMDDAMFDQISEAAHAWRPCGKCADYKKLLNNNQPKYVIAKKILGIPDVEAALAEMQMEVSEIQGGLMGDAERVDYSTPADMDPDTPVTVPLHCLQRMLSWISYTNGARPGTAFARDVSIVQESINKTRKETHHAGKRKS